MSVTKEFLDAFGELYPELDRKLDHIAAIIDPGAYSEGYIIKNHSKLANSRRAYVKAKARNNAWKILAYLDDADVREFDWTEILIHLATNDYNRTVNERTN